VRIVEEFRLAAQRVGPIAWRRALFAAAYALLLLAIFDLARAASIALERVRARKHGQGAHREGQP
jgi:hypothetical protein